MPQRRCTHINKITYTILPHTHEAGGYLGKGAMVFVATLLGSSLLMPLFSRCFLLSRDFALSIRAACILASFVAVWERAYNAAQKSPDAQSSKRTLDDPPYSP
ncbi:unnamed protein product, partial [Iphiclides podalirius]